MAWDIFTSCATRAYKENRGIWKVYRCSWTPLLHDDFDGLVRNCGNSIASTLELLQSCTKLSIFHDNTQK